MLYLIITLIIWIISGCLSIDLQIKKGYKDKHWVGFILGTIWLIYCAGLPDMSTNKTLKSIKNNIKNLTNIDDN